MLSCGVYYTFKLIAQTDHGYLSCNLIMVELLSFTLAMWTILSNAIMIFTWFEALRIPTYRYIHGWSLVEGGGMFVLKMVPKAQYHLVMGWVTHTPCTYQVWDITHPGTLLVTVDTYIAYKICYCEQFNIFGKIVHHAHGGSAALVGRVKKIKAAFHA